MLGWKVIAWNSQEVWFSNPMAFIYVQGLLFEFLLGFREEIHGERCLCTFQKTLFLWQSKGQSCPFIYQQQKHICISLQGEHPSRVLLLLIFYAPQGESAASVSSLANQAANRCSHPSLNHLTLQCHSISGFKGHQIQHHLSEQQNTPFCP